MTERQKGYLRQALVLAQENVRTGNGGPFGAVIVQDDKVIAAATNRVIVDNDPTAHAEMVAIREACRVLGHFQIEGCDLYSSCEPCPMCLGAIYWARPRSYYFACTRESAASAGFDDAYIYEELHLKPEARRIPGHCVYMEMASAPFVEWAQSLQKIRY